MSCRWHQLLGRETADAKIQVFQLGIGSMTDRLIKDMIILVSMQVPAGLLFRTLASGTQSNGYPHASLLNRFHPV